MALSPRFTLPLLVLMLLASTSVAHVILDSPNGGELLHVGTAWVITWHVVVMHNTQNWDLWYSTTGTSGPWIPIAMDLPPGDITSGSMHSYVWTVPPATSDVVYVRVRQDNNGTDYEDMSDSHFCIAPLPLAGDVSTLSLSAGGSQVMTLDAGVANAGAFYFALGSLNGTSPGINLGSETLPLNQDFYFDFTLANPNSLIWSDSIGFLDLAGQATSTLQLPSGMPPGLLAVTAHHAYVLIPSQGPITFVSNALPLLFVQ